MGSFFDYVESVVKSKGDNADSKEMQTYIKEHISLLPFFPDIEFINDLSRENYERKNCVADFLFFPFNYPFDEDELSFSYENKSISFEEKNKRLIRKMAESLDEKHALVLTIDESYNYYIKGIIKIDKKDIPFTNYYFISISGYFKWSAQCKDYGLFDCNEGKISMFNHKDTDTQINDCLCRFCSTYEDINVNNLKTIFESIVNGGHGTTLIVFESDEFACGEANRLCNAGRGFKAKKILSYNQLINSISQLTKVDGGLILDKELNCYAYGCIYDGSVMENFCGSLDRGSRYNSTKLYVHNINQKKENLCIGVVCSDDGGIECV